MCAGVLQKMGLVGPYTIEDAADLAQFAWLVSGADNDSKRDFKGVTVTLGGDINLSGHDWTPIGNNTNPFKGTFDGGGHSITNMTVNNPDAKYQGFVY